MKRLIVLIACLILGLAQGVCFGEMLGSEVLTNGDFSSWTGDDPDGWNVYEVTPNSEVSQVGTGEGHGGTGAGMCNLYSSDGTFCRVGQTGFTIGQLYKVVIVINTVTSGEIKWFCEHNVAFFQMDSTGTHTFYHIFTKDNFSISRSGACDITVASVSIKPVLSLDPMAGVGAEGVTLK